MGGFSVNVRSSRRYSRRRDREKDFRQHQGTKITLQRKYSLATKKANGPMPEQRLKYVSIGTCLPPPPQHTLSSEDGIVLFGPVKFAKNKMTQYRCTGVPLQLKRSTSMSELYVSFSVRRYLYMWKESRR
mmetsp:Transcript_2108/g.3192  ORF Transcript_2108/g.3192 Transcript_2108/m.3192 type:complete len:130 (-) Transcript_2108:43-432(-)